MDSARMCAIVDGRTLALTKLASRRRRRGVRSLPVRHPFVGAIAEAS
jgi:hypothetical protein